jgi:hypothetical protein
MSQCKFMDLHFGRKKKIGEVCKFINLRHVFHNLLMTLDVDR